MGALAEAPRHSFVVGLPSAKSNHVVEGEVDLFVHRRQLVALVKTPLCRRLRVLEALALLSLNKGLQNRLVTNRNRRRSQVSHLIIKRLHQQSVPPLPLAEAR